MKVNYYNIKPRPNVFSTIFPWKIVKTAAYQLSASEMFVKAAHLFGPPKKLFINGTLRYIP
jgi:hypothetical protein